VLTAVALLRAETCTVTGVSDGDTIQANCAGMTRTIRVSSIDSPEAGQSYGAEAKAATTALVLNCTVNVRGLITTATGGWWRSSACPMAGI
jgi:endonuclease YncB( thermonuclease family)